MASELSAGEFEDLYRATAGELFGYLRRRTTIEAEDLVAEVFVIAWRRRTDLPAPMLRRAWLFGTARKVLLAAAREQSRDRETQDHLAIAPEPAAAPGNSSATEVVTQALSRLSEADREVIRLVEWERLTPAELAVALGVRPGTARVRLHRARQALAADPSITALLADTKSRVGLSRGAFTAGTSAAEV